MTRVPSGEMAGSTTSFGPASNSNWISGRFAALAGVLVYSQHRPVENKVSGFIEAHDIRVTSSAGVASLGCCATRNRVTLIGTADRRLYAAKHSGRNRVVGEG